ncbi:hypothetical protein [Allosalinactinospora lopnorensis]|uniref:hypothetical protein n=1 Tax=Allosalinactinospora lopnorensis TaxID=1352348 RepID=UPI00069789E2|nr:hypothetical protein [Allosalinactinospora lopnorensis]
MMVFDRVKADIFVSSLRDAYQEKLGEDHIDFPDQPFAGDTIKEGGVDVFYPITQNICDAQPDMVLFAGRARDLRVFLEALSERSCRNDPISVLYGEVGLFPWTDDETMTLLEIGNITLLSAAGTDPRWARNEVPAQRDSPSSTPPTASW